MELFTKNGKPPKCSKWTYSPLTLDGRPRAVELARGRLKDSPAFLDEWEQLGRERTLNYKTLVLTGLRKNELASLTVGQLCLDEEMLFALLNAADEKNRQGSTIPLRTDLAADLQDWIVEKRARFQGRRDAFGREPLFIVPAGLVRILDRDLLAAGIDKADKRGRTLDVHALRTSFGTLLSKGGVAPRTAHAAMRHSTIDRTMNVYTDPKLLDVYGALDSLPTLNLNAAPSTERQSRRATGTDCRDASPTKDRTSELAAPVVGKVGNLCRLPPSHQTMPINKRR